MIPKQNAKKQYADIINLPYEKHKKHRMPLCDRAAQFAPFAALSGYDAMIQEESRFTDSRSDLSEEEISELNRIVNMYLDYAELQAERKIPMSMEDWAKRLDGFLEFNGNELLTGPGKISAEQAKLHAETEYEKYRIIQDRLYESDFDRFLMLEQEVKGKDEV